MIMSVDGKLSAVFECVEEELEQVSLTQKPEGRSLEIPHVALVLPIVQRADSDAASSVGTSESLMFGPKSRKEALNEEQKELADEIDKVKLWEYQTRKRQDKTFEWLDDVLDRADGLGRMEATPYVHYMQNFLAKREAHMRTFNEALQREREAKAQVEEFQKAALAEAKRLAHEAKQLRKPR